MKQETVAGADTIASAAKLLYCHMTIVSKRINPFRDNSVPSSAVPVVAGGRGPATASKIDGIPRQNQQALDRASDDQECERDGNFGLGVAFPPPGQQQLTDVSETRHCNSSLLRMNARGGFS
jgi:hypothetical protein